MTSGRVDLIMHHLYVLSCFYEFGSTSGLFKALTRLRQGDPFLLTICAEALRTLFFEG